MSGVRVVLPWYVAVPIATERQRQDEKWGWPNEGLAGNNIHKKMSILTEEVGELAKAILDGDDDNLYDELVQVAAVACAWLQSRWENGQ